MPTGFRYSTPLIIPDSSDSKDRDTQNEINYIFNALRTLAVQLDLLTGGLSPLKTDWPSYVPDGAYAGGKQFKVYANCSANIAYGAMVNLYNVAGVLTARPAQANGFAKAASGFCDVSGGFTSGTVGEFICGPGINHGIGGLTIGNWYFLDPATATGQVTATQPSAIGQVIQLCGIAIAADKLLCGSFNNWIQL